MQTRQQAERRKTGSIRAAVLERDGYTCQQCCRTFSASYLTVHHVIPVRTGGPTTMANCVTLCAACHARHHRKEDSDAAERARRQRYWQQKQARRRTTGQNR